MLRAARAAATHGLPIATHTLDRLRAEAPAVETPMAGGRPRRLRRAARRRRRGRSRAGIPRSGRASCAADPGMGRRSQPGAAQSGAPVHRRPAPARDRRAGHACTRATSRGPTCCSSARCCTTSARASRATTRSSARCTRARSPPGWASPPDDVETIAALARHHLLLPDTATRRDPDDAVTIETVTSVATTPELLQLLHSLSIADAAATGPGAWSDWKAGLIAELVRRSRRVLGGDALPPAAQLGRAAARTRRGGRARRRPRRLRGAGRAAATTSVRCTARPACSRCTRSTSGRPRS